MTLCYVSVSVTRVSGLSMLCYVSVRVSRVSGLSHAMLCLCEYLQSQWSVPCYAIFLSLVQLSVLHVVLAGRGLSRAISLSLVQLLVLPVVLAGSRLSRSMLSLYLWCSFQCCPLY